MVEHGVTLLRRPCLIGVEHSMKIMNQKKGIVLLYSVLTISIILAITVSLLSFVLKEYNITSSTRDSVRAVYAADAGIECALLWDIRGHEPAYYGDRVFATVTPSYISGGSGINCFSPVADLSSIWTVSTAGATTTTEFIVNLPNSSCTVVQVGKADGGPGLEYTSVFSRGYNVACGSRFTDLNAVERAIRVDYIFN